MSLKPNPFDSHNAEVVLPGVLRVQLERLTDARGYVSKLWQEPGFDLKEVYLTAVNPGVVKGWHRHKQMTLRLVCVSGAVMVGLGNGEKTARVFLSDGKPPFSYCYGGLIVSPGIWAGFRAVEGSGQIAVVLNLASHVHEDGEIERENISNLYPEFDWGEQIDADISA